jgi:hypothetical protein
MVLDDLQILSNRPVWLGDWNGTVESLPRGPSRALLIALKMLKESTDEGVQSWGLNLLANFAVHSQDCCQFITGLGAGEAAARGIKLALDRPKFSNNMSSRIPNRQKLPPSVYCHSHLQRECSAAHAAMRGISLFVLQVHYGVAQPWILKFMKGQLLNMTATGIDLTLDLLARHKKFAILQDRGLSLLSKIASKHPSLLFGESGEALDNPARSEFERIHEMMPLPPSSVEAPSNESESESESSGKGTALLSADRMMLRQETPRYPLLRIGDESYCIVSELGSKNKGSMARMECLRSSCRLRRIVNTAMEALYLHVEDARVQRLGICLLHELVRCGGERSRVLVTEAGADTFCQAQLQNIQSQLCEKTSREWFRHTAGMLYLLDNSPWEDTFERDALPTDGTSATKLAKTKGPSDEASSESSSQQGSATKRSTRSQAKKTEATTNFNKGSSSSSSSMAMVAMMGNAQQAQQREMVVFWMYSVTKKFRQSQETCFAAVRLFDIALSRLESTPDDHSWDLFGSSCLLLSSYCFENEPSLDCRILRNSFPHFNAFISEASIWGTARDIFKKHNCAVPKPLHWDCVKHLILLHLDPPEEDLRTRLILLVAEAFLVGYVTAKGDVCFTIERSYFPSNQVIALMDASSTQFSPTVVATTVAR